MERDGDKPYTLNDKQYVLQLLRKSSFCWFDCDENLKKDRDFLVRAILLQPMIFSRQNLGEDLFLDEAFFLELIAKQAYVFQYAAKEMRQNSDLTLRAIALNSRVIKHTTHFNNENDFLLAATQVNGEVVHHIKEQLHQNIPLIWQMWRMPKSLINDVDRVHFIEQFMLNEMFTLVAELCLASLGVFLFTLPLMLAMIAGVVTAGLGVTLFCLTAAPHVSGFFSETPLIENSAVCLHPR